MDLKTDDLTLAFIWKNTKEGHRYWNDWYTKEPKQDFSEILKKIQSVKLCLMAHPNNEVDSEFADRISDLESIEILLKKK